MKSRKSSYEHKKPKAHPGRTSLPEHLPVRQITIEPEEAITGMAKIGEEITRKVDYMWVFRNPVSGGIFFAYRPWRGAIVLHVTLEEFKGNLQSDGYSACTAYLKEQADVELVSCLTHIRRKFFDARSNHRELAELALGRKNYMLPVLTKAPSGRR